MQKSKLVTAVLIALASASTQAGELTRVATVQAGAEITGLFIQGKDLFLNAQHPDDTNPAPYNRANLMVIENANFNAGALAVPQGDDQSKVLSSMGDIKILASAGDLGLGAIRDKQGNVMLESQDPDFNAVVMDGENKGYLFTNWEDRPGGMSRVELLKDDAGWRAVGFKMLDFSAVEGTWVNCFGTLSPWGTPLSAEELYFDDTAEWNDSSAKYFESQENLEKHIGKFPNPYRYGYIIEVVDPTGASVPVKKFAMGRFSHENGVVMPDNKTVYLSDDGTNTVFFKFVADTAGDLSSGTLYAAKVTQEAGREADKTGFDVSWIKLAHASEADIAAWIAEYDGITPADFKTGGTNYISNEEIAAWAAGNAKDDRVAFLESRKAAAAKGATAEFRKMEGVHTNPMVPNKVYMAMSSVGKGMADQKGDIDLIDNKCGVVYEMATDANQSITHMKPVVAGKGYDKSNKENQCSTESVANPDNLLVLDNGDLLIGEDTGKHANNMLWVYKQ